MCVLSDPANLKKYNSIPGCFRIKPAARDLEFIAWFPWHTLSAPPAKRAKPSSELLWRYLVFFQELRRGPHRFHC